MISPLNIINKAYEEQKDSLSFHKTLDALPGEIGRLTHLKFLYIDQTQLTNLPTQIGLLINLKSLDLALNKIASLPTEIGLLTNLESLCLSHNHFLTSLPTQIGALTKLTSLRLMNNKLTFLPTEIGRLTQLRYFDCCMNRLNTLPKTFWQLREMVELSLNANKFESISFKIGRLTKLVKLHLFSNQLTALPATLGELVNLKELHVFDNQLSSLPTTLGKLTKLQELGLRENRFTSLPGILGQLTELSKLSVEKNRLVSLPPEIGQMVKLTNLELFDNRLTSLPATIGQLAKLRNLNLENNELASLPATIGQLVELLILNLSKNRLASLPPEMGRLNKLLTISVENNPALGELPLSFGEMTGLEVIQITGTMISLRIRQITLIHCRQLRDRVSLNDLPLRLSKWQAYAEDSVPFTKELTLEQRYTLNEWLRRLERTSDFQIGQQTLAKLVWGILKDLHYQEFSGFFFNQAEENNVHCQDRAAMSLNEVYTSWVLLCKSPDLPKREKLNLLAGVAKTLHLRKALQFQIAHYENARKRESSNYSGELESVEIFLYYETLLREELHLVTTITSMRYSGVGKRDWIDREALVKDVLENFCEELIEIPLFANMMQKRWDAIQIEYQAKLNALGECPKGDDHDPRVLEYQVRVGELMQAWKRKKIEAAKNELST